MNLSERYEAKLHASATDISLDGVLLQLEVTNACNHKCLFCPNAHSPRPKKMLDFDLASRAIREGAELLRNDKRICFHMNGGPLLYKRLPELVALAKSCGYDYIFLTTNGSLATPALLDTLFIAGLDSIKFSINAGTRDTYRRVHGADDFDKAMAALRYSADWRRDHDSPLKVFVSCVAVKQNYAELESFKATCEPLCDEVLFYYPGSYAGQAAEQAVDLRCDLSALDIKTFDQQRICPCPVLWNSINVTCEGHLAICCSVATNLLDIEDLCGKSLRDAWLGLRMAAVRDKHKAGYLTGLPCAACIANRAIDSATINRKIFPWA